MPEQKCTHCLRVFLDASSNTFATHKSRCKLNPKNIMATSEPPPSSDTESDDDEIYRTHLEYELFELIMDGMDFDEIAGTTLLLIAFITWDISFETDKCVEDMSGDLEALAWELIDVHKEKGTLTKLQESIDYMMVKNDNDHFNRYGYGFEGRSIPCNYN